MPVRLGSARGTVLLLLAMMALGSASAARAQALLGTYDSPLGPLVVEEKDGVVTAKTAAAGGPCGFTKGKVVFEGTRLDDSVTGAFTACKLGPGCAGEVSGMVMLLITRSGGLLFGAVHLDGGKCKTPIEGDGITLRRVGAGAAAEASSKASLQPAKENKPRVGATKRTPRKHASSPGAKRNEGARQRAEALAAEGAKLLDAGAIEDARAKFLEATKVDPTYSEGYVGVGVTYYARDRYDEALEYYKKGLEANPGNPDAYYNTACVYALKGEAEQALRYLQIAVLNGYIDIDTLATDPDLKALEGNETFERMKRGEL